MFRSGSIRHLHVFEGDDVTGQVRAFIITNFLFNAGSLGDDQSLIGSGVIDAAGMVDLAAFLKQTFGITVAAEDLVPENIDSVARIAAFVAARKGG